MKLYSKFNSASYKGGNQYIKSGILHCISSKLVFSKLPVVPTDVQMHGCSSLKLSGHALFITNLILCSLPQDFSQNLTRLILVSKKKVFQA